jgi:hypothetical protein
MSTAFRPRALERLGFISVRQSGSHLILRKAGIRNTPTWPQFQKIVEEIRNQRLSDDAKESADLVDFMGLAASEQTTQKLNCSNSQRENS